MTTQVATPNARHNLQRPTAETRRILDAAMVHVRSVPYRVSLRWLFYRLLQDGLYRGKGDYGRAKDIFARARLSFFDGWRPDTLADDTRAAVVRGDGYESPAAWCADFSEALRITLDHWLTQPYCVEVWFEARAMQGQFEHYVNEHVTLMAFGGDTTIAPKWQSAARLAAAWRATHAPIRVLYFGDDDEKGHEIPRNAWQDIKPWGVGMPTSPASPCSAAGCSRLKPCPVHPHKPWTGGHCHPGGRAWQRTRQRIFARDGYRCTYCGAPAEVVDHVIALAHGGSDDDSNLVAACERCNEARRRIQARGGSVTLPTRTAEPQRDVTF